MQSGAPHPQPPAPPHDGLEAVPRQARRRAKGSGARAARRLGGEGHRGRARPPAGTAGQAASGGQEAAAEPPPCEEPRPRHRRGEARGLVARRRKVHVAARFRRHLRLDPAPRDRSRRPARQGRPVDGRQLPPDLRRPQPARRTPGLRRRMDGPVHERCTGDMPPASRSRGNHPHHWGHQPPGSPLRPILVSRRRRHSQQCLRRGAEDRANPSALCLGAIQPRSPSPEDQHCGEG